MMILDAAQMNEKAQAHRYLAEMLALPDYYGRNLDALYDCLTELGETEIRFVNLEEAGGTYFFRVLSVFREAEIDNPKLHIIYDFS